MGAAGPDPRHLMTPNFFDKSVPKEKTTVFIYMSEIENYDFRIDTIERLICEEFNDTGIQ